MTDPRLIVALDFASAEAALALADRLDPRRCRVKVGKELFTRAGPAVIEQLVRRGFEVFLDLKYHDIPNTVAAACAAAAELGVWMLNVHASGGLTMMQAARERLESLPQRPLLIAVTLLTSLDDADLAAIGCPGRARDRVAVLADQKRVMTPSQAIAAGADHLVIGRPITAAADPRTALAAIAAELAAGPSPPRLSPN
ncbi:MAG: orotidine-5'-phosphate decarboxylase [Halochromatium sp.]